VQEVAFEALPQDQHPSLPRLMLLQFAPPSIAAVNRRLLSSCAGCFSV
jgi:hypothetical protein